MSNGDDKRKWADIIYKWASGVLFSSLRGLEILSFVTIISMRIFFCIQISGLLQAMKHECD